MVSLLKLAYVCNQCRVQEHAKIGQPTKYLVAAAVALAALGVLAVAAAAFQPMGH